MTMTAMATQNLLDDPAFVTLFTTIVAVRFLVPLAIFRWPLPGIIASLVIVTAYDRYRPVYDHRRAQAAADASAH